eukprot:TRINITY_DN79507_c0_g1_i1.p1 TRINITY_DN79507_c0_g1~~TRINITY_DN79507_c0_g1_i1.p1  ORF type:complete len:111 (-),score=10.76 TRINITY_DN79507_c0_g1_i1:28-360(-)
MQPSLHVVENLMRHTVILAHHHFLKLTLAVALSIRTASNAKLAVVVLRQPARTGSEALRSDIVNWVLVLFPRLQVGRMVLWEVREELRAVGERHVLPLQPGTRTGKCDDA